MAVVDPYEALTITPGEGEVESLQHFTITFDSLSVVVNENAVPTLEKGGGGSYSGTMRAGDDGMTVIVDFEECVTAPGHYFLNLPENSITVNGTRLVPLSLRFNIVGSMDTFYEQITIDPAEGEVESLQYFTISLPEYVGEIDYSSRVTLTNTTTGTVYYPAVTSVGYGALVYLSQEVTEPGEYLLTVPAGAIVIYTLDEEVHELTFNYTINGGDLLLGDVDQDGKIGISDVTALIDILLNGVEAPAEADVDQNGNVGIADVTALIDMILTNH